jgi:hypothetical protein
VALDGHIKVWADGLSFASAFSHPQHSWARLKGSPAGRVRTRVELCELNALRVEFPQVQPLREHFARRRRFSGTERKKLL